MPVGEEEARAALTACLVDSLAHGNAWLQLLLVRELERWRSDDADASAEPAGHDSAALADLAVHTMLEQRTQADDMLASWLSRAHPTPRVLHASLLPRLRLVRNLLDTIGDSSAEASGDASAQQQRAKQRAVARLSLADVYADAGDARAAVQQCHAAIADVEAVAPAVKRRPAAARVAAAGGFAEGEGNDGDREGEGEGEDDGDDSDQDSSGGARAPVRAQRRAPRRVGSASGERFGWAEVVSLAVLKIGEAAASVCPATVDVLTPFQAVFQSAVLENVASKTFSQRFLRLAGAAAASCGDLRSAVRCFYSAHVAARPRIALRLLYARALLSQGRLEEAHQLIDGRVSETLLRSSAALPRVDLASADLLDRHAVAVEEIVLLLVLCTAWELDAARALLQSRAQVGKRGSGRASAPSMASEDSEAAAAAAAVRSVDAIENAAGHAARALELMRSHGTHLEAAVVAVRAALDFASVTRDDAVGQSFACVAVALLQTSPAPVAPTAVVRGLVKSADTVLRQAPDAAELYVEQLAWCARVLGGDDAQAAVALGGADVVLQLPSAGGSAAAAREGELRALRSLAGAGAGADGPALILSREQEAALLGSLMPADWTSAAGDEDRTRATPHAARTDAASLPVAHASTVPPAAVVLAAEGDEAAAAACVADARAAAAAAADGTGVLAASDAVENASGHVDVHDVRNASDVCSDVAQAAPLVVDEAQAGARGGASDAVSHGTAVDAVPAVEAGAASVAALPGGAPAQHADVVPAPADETAIVPEVAPTMSAASAADSSASAAAAPAQVPVEAAPATAEQAAAAVASAADASASAAAAPAQVRVEAAPATAEQAAAAVASAADASASAVAAPAQVPVEAAPTTAEQAAAAVASAADAAAAPAQVPVEAAPTTAEQAAAAAASAADASASAAAAPVQVPVEAAPATAEQTAAAVASAADASASAAAAPVQVPVEAAPATAEQTVAAVASAADAAAAPAQVPVEAAPTTAEQAAAAAASAADASASAAAAPVQVPVEAAPTTAEQAAAAVASAAAVPAQPVAPVAADATTTSADAALASAPQGALANVVDAAPTPLVDSAPVEVDAAVRPAPSQSIDGVATLTAAADATADGTGSKGLDAVSVAAATASTSDAVAQQAVDALPATASAADAAAPMQSVDAAPSQPVSVLGDDVVPEAAAPSQAETVAERMRRLAGAGGAMPLGGGLAEAVAAAARMRGAAGAGSPSAGAVGASGKPGRFPWLADRGVSSPAPVPWQRNAPHAGTPAALASPAASPAAPVAVSPVALSAAAASASVESPAVPSASLEPESSVPAGVVDFSDRPRPAAQRRRRPAAAHASE